MTKKILLCLLALCYTPFLNAQVSEQLLDELSEKSSLTLDQSIQIALANNASVKRALLSVKLAQKDVVTAWAEVMPDVTSSVNYTRNLEVPVNFLPEVIFNPDGDPNKLIPVAFGTDNNWSGGFTVSQNIFKGEALVGISSAEIYLAAQKESERATAQQVVTNTRVAFYSVLLNEENFRLQKDKIKRLEDNLYRNQKRYKAGLLDEYDVLRLEVQLANERPVLIEAESAVNESYRTLSITMGLPASIKIPVDGDLSNFNVMDLNLSDDQNDAIVRVHNMTPLQNETPQNLFETRSNLRLLDIQKELKKKEISAYKSRFLPTLAANYNLQWTAAQAGSPNFFGDSDQRARSQTIGVNFSLPLFQGFRRMSTVQKAIIERRDIEVQEYEALQNAESQLATLFETFNKVKISAEARLAAIKQAERGYKIAKSRFESGVATQLDVDEAQNELQQAQYGYAGMVVEFLTAKANYDQAIGLVPYVDVKPIEK